MQNLLHSPVFPDIERTQTARILNFILWAVAGSASLLLIGVVTIPGASIRWMITLLLAWIIFFILQWDMRRGNIKRTSILLVFSIWFIVTMLAVSAGGIRAPSIMMYPLMVFIAGFLLGSKAGLHTAIFSVTTLLVLILLENARILPAEAMPQSTFSLWIVNIMFISLMVSLQHLAEKTVSSATRRSIFEQHERKETEAHLRSTEEMLATTFEMSPDAIVLTTLKEGRIIQCNNEFLRQMGYEYNEIIGRTTSELNIWPSNTDRTDLMEIVRHAGGVRNIEIRIRRKDNSFIPIMFSCRIITVAGEEILLTVAHDNTERQRYETALRKSEEELRNLFDNAVLGIYRTTPDGRILMVNPALCRMLGYTSPEELENRNLEIDAYHPNYSRSEFKKKIETNNVIKGQESVWLKADGGKIYVRENAQGIRDQNGTILYYEGTIEDITEKIAAEQAMKESEKHFHRLFENLTEGFTVYRIVRDTNGEPVDLEITDLNSAGAQFEGFSREEMIGKRYLELFAPEDGSFLRSIFRVAQKGRPSVERYWANRRDSRRFIETRSYKTAEDLVAVIASDHTDEENARMRLADSGKRLRQALRVGRMGYIDCDLVTKEVEWSEETYHMYGSDPAELSPTLELTLGLVHPDDRHYIEHAIKSVLSGENEIDVRFRIFRRDAQIIYIHALGEVTRDPDGRPVLLLCTIIDITEQEMAARALRETEARLRQVIDLVPQFIFAKNKEGKFILVNNAVAAAYGTTVEGLLGKSDADFNPNTAEVSHFVNDDLEVIASGRMKDIPEEMMTDSTGQRRVLHTVKIPFYPTPSSETAILGVSTDITDRKLIEDELRRTAAQLRKLSNRLLAIREDESTRIAREIHDELGQTLTALKIDLAFLEDTWKMPDGADAEKVKARITGMSSLVDSAIQTIRRISSELRPVVLDRFGLVAAIEWQADEFRKRTGIPCHCKMPAEELEVDPDTSITIFRILQESLTNITRHAHATEVHISLRRKAAALTLQVDDNGRGISPVERDKPGSFGLLGIQERASVLNGVVTISTAPDKGTSIIVTIPIRT